MQHKTIRVEIRITRKTLAALAGTLLLVAGLRSAAGRPESRDVPDQSRFH